MPLSTKFILPLYGALAIYTLGYFNLENGWIDLVLEKRQQWLNSVPTDPSIRQRLTEIEGLDEPLTIMYLFYWPVVDGTFPALSVRLFHIFGTLALATVVLSLESSRKGNRSSM